MNAFCLSLAVICAATAVFSYLSAERMRKNVTEVALSFCAEELEKAPETRSTEHLRNYLAFADLPETVKQTLLTAVTVPQDLLEKMRYFSFDDDEMRTLCKEIEGLRDQTVAAFRLSDAAAYDYTGGEKMIRSLFGSVALTETKIEGGKRYACGNICIDLCENDSVRFLCDIRSGGDGERILRYFFKNAPFTVTHSEILCGTEIQTITGDACTAEVCRDPGSGKIFAGVIKYR